MHYRWQSAPFILLRVVSSLPSVVAADVPLIPALLGLNLGSMHITAATINGSGTFPLILVEGPQSYIDFMNNITNPDLPLEDYYDGALDLIENIIEDTQLQASHVHGTSLRVGAILTPEHFTFEMRELVSRSWHTVTDGVLARFPRPVSYSAIVYPGNDCLDRFYNMELPYDQGEWILMIHRDFGHLSMSLSMLTSHMYESTSHSIAVSASADDVVKNLRSIIDSEDDPNITSIVLSSHDAHGSFQVVREALDRINVRLWSRRKRSPLALDYMAAVGAACMARQLAIFPIEEEDDCAYPLVDDENMITPVSHVQL